MKRFLLMAVLVPCELTYQGVIGNGKDMIAVLKEENSKKTFVIPTGKDITECDARVEDIKRNAIVVRLSGERLILRSQGNEKSSEGSKDDLTDGYARELSELENKYFDNLVELGQKAVEEGSVTADEVNKMLAQDFK